mmetsp:Transcript_1621/g.2489  ORF Transcript_1621/g.2489 Transcript_1621/m.2489 type:complete len:204 (-) Transcript_1621:229-840(-)|eukprot:CAMPEP_0196133024 /NCGR_PEP_ID=MMETSP0910-20130528/2415_1 /TAXON_ID=49265 /ORGANISM="Thalassiosira rotula, Strain GSO102" /LENGTH=203 /DNA_ID=CAMNT_0041392701 /DNA_START=179 /DNA_END=790 /DNA_ORIENTATION=+
MKLFLIAALATSVTAFAPSQSGRTSIALRSAGSAEIEAALAASKEFGATSKEARVLWDIVEEMDASDNSAAFKAPVEDAEYESKVKALSQMLTSTKDELDQMRALADELKGVKIATPSSSSGSGDSDAMKSALAAAKAASEANGKDSVEAKLAWETVEEIAASATDGEASRPSLDEECLIELIEGCEALEKFKSTLDALEMSE